MYKAQSDSVACITEPRFQVKQARMIPKGI